MLLGREHPVKVLALAAMITVNNRINSVKLKHMVVWLFAVNLGLGSAFAGAGSVYDVDGDGEVKACLLYTSPSPRDAHESRMPSSA